MNIVLFRSDEISRPLPPGDRRTEHLMKVLNIRPGDVFDLGIIDGPRGKGTVVSIGEGSIFFRTDMGADIPESFPIILILGAVRPAAAGRILRDASTLGLASVWVFASQKSEASYLKSRVWDAEAVRRLFIEGAEQGFTTRLPELRIFTDLPAVLAALPAIFSGIAMDNYEAECSLHEWKPGLPCALAIGSERGWSGRERQILRSGGFTLASAGTRVLKTETAVVAASAVILSNLGYW